MKQYFLDAGVGTPIEVRGLVLLEPAPRQRQAQKQAYKHADRGR